MNTVPPAWIVSISPRFWAKHFAQYECHSGGRAPASTSEEDHLSMLIKILDKQFGPGSIDNVVVQAWMQPMVDPRALINKPSELNQLKCGLRELAVSKGDGAYPPHFVTDYYKMMMVILVGGKFDTAANCFAVDSQWGTPQWCDDQGGAHSLSSGRFQGTALNMRPINLDNDQLTFRYLNQGLNESSSTLLRAPCAIPREVRARVMSVRNFTHAVNKRLHDDFPVLGWLDYARIEKFAGVSASIVERLQSQFSKCQQ